MQDDRIPMALGVPRLRFPWQEEMEKQPEVSVVYRKGEAVCHWRGKAAGKEYGRWQHYRLCGRLPDQAL